jgi:hypothetical protein
MIPGPGPRLSPSHVQQAGPEPCQRLVVSPSVTVSGRFRSGATAAPIGPCGAAPRPGPAVPDGDVTPTGPGPWQRQRRCRGSVRPGPDGDGGWATTWHWQSLTRRQGRAFLQNPPGGRTPAGSESARSDGRGPGLPVRPGLVDSDRDARGRPVGRVRSIVIADRIFQGCGGLPRRPGPARSGVKADSDYASIRIASG